MIFDSYFWDSLIHQLILAIQYIVAPSLLYWLILCKLPNKYMPHFLIGLASTALLALLLWIASVDANHQRQKASIDMKIAQ